MKYRLLTFASSILFIAGLLAIHPETATRPDLSELDWMLHTWQRTNVRPGTTAFETWQKESDQLYTGLGVSMKGTDTTFVEKLRIEVKGDDMYYVADVKENAEPTYFLISEVSSTGFKSANPEHDYPKNIDYSLDGDKMVVIISDRGEKHIGFMFTKKP